MTRNDFRRRVGSAIRDRRVTLRVSQEAFADRIGMHRTYFGTVERGEKDFRLSTLLRVAAGLGVPLSRLLNEVEREGGSGSIP